ncbi:MAG TPA: serine hydrolase domain-containing protein [Longimicrobiales bacterium]|nr:serine hydrolase domain-containing protein [Longimicrobiales bacterium]
MFVRRTCARPQDPILGALLLTLTLAAPGLAQEQAIPEDVGMSSERLELLTEVFEEYVEEGRLPGAVIRVHRVGFLVYEQAFGQRDVESGDPMESDDIFRIASQTKAIVSAAVLMLQEEGKLLIQAPVGRYLPEYMETTVAVPREGGGYDVVPAERAITVRDLLTHTAGIGYGNGPAADRWAGAGIQGWYFAHLEEPIRETVRRMAALPMDAQPGERFVYGYNTDILGALVEVASGMALDEYLRTRIFEPLGMTDTHFYLPADKADRLAVVYRGGPDAPLERSPESGGMRGQGLYVDGPRTSFSGGAGLLSTAHDYARFLQAILNGGELDGNRILSPKSVEIMTANHIGDLMGAGSGIGLGFRVVRDLGARGQIGSEGEFSWGGAYHSTYWGDFTEDLVVSYFTQVAPAQGLDDHPKLRALVYGAITESYGAH